MKITVAMDHQETIWIKKEETDVDPDEPGLVFLEDTLKMEMPALPMESDPDQKLCMDSSETNFVKDELGISWTTHFIKEDPSLNLEADETANIIVDATKCAPNSTRLIQNSRKSCGISFEETVMQGHVPNDLEIRAVESPHLTIFDTQTQRLEEEDREQEKDSLAARVKCSWRENEFHTFSCNFCLQSFTSKYRLIKHVFFHMEGVQQPTYICKSCGEVFSSDIGLNKHLKMNEEDSPTHRNHKTDGIDKHENMSSEGYEMFSVGEQTEKQYSSQLKSRAVRAPGTLSLKCDICGKSFKRLNYLKCHLLIHTGMRPHKCDVCGKAFTILQNLKMHSLIHTGIKPHKCDVCGRSFTYVGNLNKHAIIHTGLRPHKCNVCDKSFKHLGNLKSHLLIHIGIKPHKCDVCGKAFRELGTLRNHALIHTGIKPHKCNVCGKCFTQLSDLKTHSLIHAKNRHKCDVCGKSFTKLDALKKHEVKHSGSRPHKCDVCGKSFTRLYSLKTHEMRHNGIRRRKCDVCGKTFTELDQLKMHASIHTGTQMSPHM